MRTIIFSLLGIILTFGDIVITSQLIAAEAVESESEKKTGEAASSGPHSDNNPYRIHCASCHGADGRGTAVLRQMLGANVIDLTSIEQAIKLVDIDLIALINDGRPKSGMPAFKTVLTPEQVTEIIQHMNERIIPSLSDKTHLRQGQKIYQRHCSVCHGDRGQVAMWAKAGLDPSPADFSNPEKRDELKRQRMLFSVSNGRPDTAMTSWLGRFDAKQIESVVDYIRVALMQKNRFDAELGFARGKGAPANDPFMSASNFDSSQLDTVSSEKAGDTSSGQMNVNESRRAPDPFLDNPDFQNQAGANEVDDIFDPLDGSHDHEAHMGAGDLNAPLPGGMVGDRTRGETLYMDNCSACHGEKGDGKGPRAFFIFPKPRNFHHPAVVNKFNRAHIYTQVSKGIEGTVMPAWSRVLSRQQIADITEFLFVDTIHGGNPPDSSN